MNKSLQWSIQCDGKNKRLFCISILNGLVRELLNKKGDFCLTFVLFVYTIVKRLAGKIFRKRRPKNRSRLSSSISLGFTFSHGFL